MSNQPNPWTSVHFPIEPGDVLPPERKVVAVWLKGSHLPFCGYVRHREGGAFFVVYHGNSERGVDVIAWSDCLPGLAPEQFRGGVYEQDRNA